MNKKVKGLTMADTSWKDYEEVATYLLNEFAKKFGLDRVESKQKVEGMRSGTMWEIDAKGVREDDGGFMIVECRRYTKTKQPQEDVGALAYRILDIGAAGGIVVSPLDFQKGADKIAKKENIFSVTLTPDSTILEFQMGFLGKFRAATTLQAGICGVAKSFGRQQFE